MPPTTHEVRLSNGLEVILKAVHTAPIVSTWIWYRVDSRNETEGLTGMSHWVEHMMFKGSSKFPKGSIMRAVERYGGYGNAMTSHDFTAYYETLPCAQAELALQIEADRMTTAAFDPAEVKAERTVVIAEREGAENQPQFVLAEEMSAVAFRLHPYHHGTIGWKADLLRITRDQLYAHYRQHYVPNNAVLVVVGHLDAESHLELIRQYFEAIPAGEPPAATVRQEPDWRGERRVTLRMPGHAPLIHLSYAAAPVSHPDYIPLVVLDALLSGGKAMFAFGSSQTRSARLYRALVETELASSAGSGYHPSLDPYLFSLGATVRDERSPAAVEEALLREVLRLQQDTVSAKELAVAIRQTQAQFAYSSESVTHQGLTLGFLDMLDSHTRMDGLLDELAEVTPDDIVRVARTYLNEEKRIVGIFLPTEKDRGGADADVGQSDAACQWDTPNRGMFAYSSAPQPPIGPDTILRRQLDNGPVILVRENPASASVTVEGSIQAGSIHDEDDHTGIAGLTAAVLRRGTEAHSAQEINVALDNVGASLDFGAGRNIMSFGGQSLAADFFFLVDLLAEILMRPTFPQVELDKLRGQVLTHLGVLQTDTGYRADRAFMTNLYPDGHPYQRSSLGTRESLPALTPSDLRRFYQTFYHPESLILAVSGAVRADDVVSALERAFGDWRVGHPPHPWDVPPAQTPAEIKVQKVDIPGKAQVDLIWGVVGMPRSSPDYYAAMMANLILGRLGLMGRLGARLRDSEGLAYYVSSSSPSSRGPYPWTISAGVHPDNLDRARSSILDEVERLRNELVDDDELADGQTYLKGTLPLHLETNSGIASFLLRLEQYDLGLDYLQRYPQIIDGIDRDEIQSTVHKYLTTDRYVLAMAGTFG